MKTLTPHSITLCPLNFGQFAKLQQRTDSLEASALLAKLHYHYITSKIEREGKTCLIRSREALSSWFGFSVYKTDRLLALLEEKGLIEKTTCLWYSQRCLSIRVSEAVEAMPLNVPLLQQLIETTGSLQAALVFSRIAFSFAHTQIVHENKKWCCLARKHLAEWAGVSLRTLDRV